MDNLAPKVVIVDYALGNLFSVKHACEHVGLDAVITASKKEITNADAVLLPGMGAFGDAMNTLHRLDLVAVLMDYAVSGRPLLGICLGSQLLLGESHEFGHHQGLGIIDGSVLPLRNPREDGRNLKVPQIGWNQIHRASPWEQTPLEGISDGEYMYFVHTFFPQPQDHNLVLATTDYGGIKFCTSYRSKNIFACLFHPERSGQQGLKIYANLALQIRSASKGDKQ